MEFEEDIKTKIFIKKITHPNMKDVEHYCNVHGMTITQMSINSTKDEVIIVAQKKEARSHFKLNKESPIDHFFKKDEGYDLGCGKIYDTEF